MRTVKSWKLALAGVIALSGATAGNTKVIALNATASTMADGEGSSARLLGQPNTRVDYVKSGYGGPGLAPAHDFGTGDSHPSTGSKRSAGIRATDTGMILLTIGTLVAYQLRRKQRLLRQSPFVA